MAGDILECKSSYADAIRVVKILSALPIVLLSIILVSLIIIISISQPVDADVIRSENVMAIGTVYASCANDTIIETDGFCSMVFGESKTYSEGVLLLELRLFDMSPRYVNCSVNCNITGAEIFDADGNPIRFMIERSRDDPDSSNGSDRSDRLDRYDNGHYGKYGRTFPILLLLLLLVSGFILLKISLSYRND